MQARHCGPGADCPAPHAPGTAPARCKSRTLHDTIWRHQARVTARGRCPKQSWGESMATLELRDPKSCQYDFLALGALVQRFDPGLVPLHEADQFQRHCSGAEYNPAANLAACFRLRTAVASANVQYPPGWWVESQVRRAGVAAHYKWFPYDGVRGPRIANTYSDRGIGVRGPEGLVRPCQRGGGAAGTGGLRLAGPAGDPGSALVPLRRHLRIAFTFHLRPHRGRNEGRAPRRDRGVL